MIASRSRGTLRWRGGQIGNQVLHWFVFAASIIGYVCRTFSTSYFRHGQETAADRSAHNARNYTNDTADNRKCYTKHQTYKEAEVYIAGFVKILAFVVCGYSAWGLRRPLCSLYTQRQASETIREADQCWMSHCPSICPLCIFAKCMLA